MTSQNHYRTIVISDVHLGTKGSKAKELVRFLKMNTADNLILNGDIIDGWQLKKSGEWKRKHTRFIQRVLKMVSEFNTQVIYLRGNHDDFLDQFIPLTIGNLKIVRDWVWDGANGKKYYITHGDIFDSVTTKFTWLAKLGDIGYTFLLWINRKYNEYREMRGLPYYSISQLIKSKVKSAVSYISDYEGNLVELAVAKGCQGIICGHIHQPAIKNYEAIEYLNSGDWVESLSALVEDYNGEWSLMYFSETKRHKSDTDENDEIFDDTDDMDLPVEFMTNKEVSQESK
ncbi:MAG: UDP-2,3-diacylglucosamine diphosphatase [Bacteroidota bacterium]|nr:UDP-2,3-diacylglucosamine diphosphatase [Bacteroidota bacterium]